MAGIQPPELRWPRLAVLAGGVPLAGAFAAEVLSNNHYAADRFAVSVALSADPVAVGLLAGPEVLLEVRVSLEDGAGFASLVTGEVDDVEIDPMRGVARLTGRDLSARLIEARTHETFANRTASEIAALLAARHGLSADVAPTATPVGRYWQLGRDRIVLDAFARATTEWDLLAALAGFEGFDLWVSGTVLHFRPRAADADGIALTPGELTGLRLERSLTLARDIEVAVKSWHSRSQRAFVQVARKGTRPAPRGRVQRFVYVVPNLTPDEALKLAQARLAELTQHERVVVAEMPGELDIMPRSRLLLSGTGTDFDQDYVVDRVERHISVAEGFRQTVWARNVSAGAQFALGSEEGNWNGS